MAWKIAVCDGCGVENPGMIVLKNKIWLSIAEKTEILCYTCIEKRLNRKLTINDLKPDISVTQMILLGLRMGHGIAPPKDVDVLKIASDLAVMSVATGSLGRGSKLQHGISFCLNGRRVMIPSKRKITNTDLAAVQSILGALIEAGIRQYERRKADVK